MRKTPQEFRLAPVFDHVDPVTGPSFAPDHPVLDDAGLTALLLRRLEAGTVVLASPVLMKDVVDPTSGPTVPMNYCTDGEWIWADTVTYYLRTYGLAPAPALVGHLRNSGERSGPVSREAAEAAVAFLLAPPETRGDYETEAEADTGPVVWTVG